MILRIHRYLSVAAGCCGWKKNPLFRFLPSFFIAGITGASYVAANTYMADISNGANRIRNFGYLNAVMGVGFILGPAIGRLLGQFGTHAPFIAAPVLSMANFSFRFFAGETEGKENGYCRVIMYVRRLSLFCFYALAEWTGDRYDITGSWQYCRNGVDGHPVPVSEQGELHVAWVV